ncbi:DICT sensory domain-containing protein [Micromonospora sp. 4G57]|uniref:DICT sensory domain-containing protein n=1 Tax=Micromonospora sicca TaxID=2202420 RepID=A0ABU5J722_9ACTN|nr:MULTISPECIES: DICT sensory domain-containing protein [unclassified Micromonospora]MDZ5442942.1 DICT sensory domain-containing protein [Micromonospora sp. 4G57]MDZ5488347.1 DICT sensory domain-containing protein [Micromonospora sp. 4G53]
MPQSGRTPQRSTKRSLVAVSHAIERAALATAEDGPLVVFALFQRRPYFARERAVYERIAASAAVTVVGMVGPPPPELPAGAYGVMLDEAEELAREWTVVALTPRFGATLVAYDRGEVAPAVSLEAGRLFEGHWGFRRDEALHEVIRLRARLADRLPESARSRLDEVVARVRDIPAGPGESRAEAAIRMLAARGERAHPPRQAEPVDTPAGLLDEPGLRRWTGMDGVTASGTLPVALVGVRVDEPAGAPERFGRRSAARETQAVLAAVTGVLRPVDRAIRLADNEYLLMLPALHEQGALDVAGQVHEAVGGLARSYPFVAFGVHAAVTVTDRRPLPVADVRHAVEWAAREGVPVATLAPEPARVAASAP